MKKSELISLINTYVSARLTNDERLIKFSVESLTEALNQLEFEPEDEPETTENA